MTNYSALSIEQVLYLHEKIIELARGIQGVRDFALLHSGLERCKATFAGEDLYPSVFEKAAALLHSLVMNHPFLDGNKRTAYETMKRFLYVNGYAIVATKSEIITLCLAADNEGWGVRQISTWVAQHTRATP